MKYVFFLSLCYKHFKKPCSFRIHVDNVLVDEVVLDKDINPIKDFEKNYINESNKWLYRGLVILPMPEKIWIYHIDLEDTNKNIFLDFNVNDNNYSNGFMSQSAMVKIRCAGLIKESTFYKSTEFFMDYAKKIKKKFLRIEKNWLDHKPEDLDNWQLTDDYPMGVHQDNALNRGVWKWPNYMFRYPSVGWFPIKNSASTEEKKVRDQWCGGNFLVELNLIKKHKNMMIKEQIELNESDGQPTQVKGVVDFDPYIIWLKQLPEVINIYNEDQRSNS